MIDTVSQYAIQFAAITAGAMALSEWAKLPIGTAGSTRKRYCCLLYSAVLGELGLWAGLVELPGINWMQDAAGVVVMAVVSTGAAHLAIAAKRKIKK